MSEVPSYYPKKMDEDPNGLDQHSSGAKLDAGKPRVGLVLGGFANALLEISKVGTYGAAKYTDNGWRDVEDGVSRYSDAMFRHLLQEHSEGLLDKESEMMHAAMAAWNAMARLERILVEMKDGKP